MKVLNRRCAGLDVHKDEVVACVRLAMRNKLSHEVRRFATTTRGLLELADWLEASGVTQVAMEATGVYWKPVWHMLEERFQLVLANAAHVHNVPGRKSDVNDATWIADLMAHGLIRASFVPPAPIQELRDLTRTRKQLGREIVQHTQRIQKVLEDANIKLSSLITEVLGASGRRILKALIAGESDAGALAALGGPRLKCSRQELRDALEGRITSHHRFLVGQHLRMIEELEATVTAFDARIEAVLAPFRDAAERLMSLPGISDVAAQVILAEIGTDMSSFPTAGCGCAHDQLLAQLRANWLLVWTHYRIGAVFGCKRVYSPILRPQVRFTDAIPTSLFQPPLTRRTLHRPEIPVRLASYRGPSHGFDAEIARISQRYRDGSLHISIAPDRQMPRGAVRSDPDRQVAQNA